MIEVTKATLGDIPELCSLLELLFIQESEFKPNHELQARGLAAVIGGSDIGNILIMRKSGQVVGMVNLLYTISTVMGERVAILEDLVIAPAERGIGSGTHLLEYAIKFAQEKGCRRITLLTDHNNDSVHRFYERHGFSRSSMTAFRLLLT